MTKERPLTERQRNALLAAEATLYGDTKLIEGFGRSVPGLRKRGLVEGEIPHVYLTDAGKLHLNDLVGEGAHHARPSGQFAPSQSTALSPKEDA